MTDANTQSTDTGTTGTTPETGTGTLGGPSTPSTPTTASAEGTTIATPAATPAPWLTAAATPQAPIVDKTLAEIASGEVKKVEGDASQLGAKVRHPAHNILDEVEAHLSQFDARAVPIWYGFLQRLRNAI